MDRVIHQVGGRVVQQALNESKSIRCRREVLRVPSCLVEPCTKRHEEAGGNGVNSIIRSVRRPENTANSGLRRARRRPREGLAVA